tara:strand:- start:3313 stop:4404 length:1092 start_codon:yes stop_codon:yes gene_type:complete
MESMEDVDVKALQERLSQVERENRILRKKLQRSEKNRQTIEDIHRKNETFLRQTILELHEARETIEQINMELEKRVQSRTLALQGEIKERKLAETRLRELNEELKQAHEMALQASHAKSNFLARMSHELRTPLNAIIGYSEMLMEDLEEGALDIFREDLKRIHHSGQHLLQLINDILDLSKIEAGKMEILNENFDVHSFALEIVGMCTPLAQKNNNRVELMCSSSIGTMRTDRVKLRQMLLNLLSNASKFTSEGEIRIEIVRMTSPTGRELLSFAVQDTGIGISEKHQRQIFEPFQQSDNSSTRKYEGTGLGLAICRNLCRMLGGDLSVESQLDVGSTFSFALPVVPLPKTQSRTPLPRGLGG